MTMMMELELTDSIKKEVEKIAEDFLVKLAKMFNDDLNATETDLDRAKMKLAQSAALAWFTGVHVAEDNMFEGLLNEAITWNKAIPKSGIKVEHHGTEGNSDK